ncbi:MAG: M13 family metallopeptidase [Gemmatimonadota bacterium]
MRSIRRRLTRGGVHTIVCASAMLATAMCLWPRSLAHAQAAAERPAPELESGVDSSIKPGDDFFAFANGGWLKATEIPAGKPRWGVRNELDAKVSLQVHQLLDDASRAAAGSLARKVADYRAAYMNEAAIAAKGLNPIRPVLDSIDQLRDKAGLTRLLGRQLRADVDPLNFGTYQSSALFGLSVSGSVGGEKDNVAFLVQGGLGLPDRTYYVGNEPNLQAIRARYQTYIAHQLKLAGFDRAEQRAASVLALETAIAQVHATTAASTPDHNADTLWTRAELAHQAPGMDWNLFFAAAGLSSQQSFVPWQPGAIRGEAAMVGSRSLDEWKDYLRFHAIDHYADLLPRAFADEAFALYGTAVAGQAEQAPRADRAFSLTQSTLNEAVGRLYVERYFSPKQKARVEAIVANVTAAFIRQVDSTAWMSPESRKQAVAKLKTLYVGIGYPEKWQDYSDLVVDPADPLGNFRRVEDRTYRQAVARLGQPVDQKYWWIGPATAGGVLTFQLNAYDFSAALMQAPKYDSTMTDAAAYGSIGAVIGHDVSHFIDVLGAEFELGGRERRWWTSEDSSRFEAAAKPLVDQFSAYQPFPGVNVNGRLTRTENVADLAGLTAALDAYHRTLGPRISDKAFVREQDRQFFIAFARSFHSKLSEPAMREQIAKNDHAPETFRISTVRNLDAWYDAFDVRPGERLYLEPKARVKVW